MIPPAVIACLLCRLAAAALHAITWVLLVPIVRHVLGWLQTWCVHLQCCHISHERGLSYIIVLWERSNFGLQKCVDVAYYELMQLSCACNGRVSW